MNCFPLIRRGARLALAALWLTATFACAQTDDLPTFGTTVVIPGGLVGKIYFLQPNTWVLPNFDKLEPVGTIYTKVLNISPRDFREGFPGITERVEWFAIDFNGRFYVDTPGEYRFRVESDDGAKLYIDQKLLIDNDGDHPAVTRSGTVNLSGGVHSLRLSYYQGPPNMLALVFSVAKPGQRSMQPFNTDNFKPPSNPADWKYGAPEDWKDSPDPHFGRREVKDAMVAVPVAVFSHDKPVRDLKAEDFLVYDNKELKPIQSFRFAEQALDIVLLLDESPGMRRFRGRINNSAFSILSKLDHSDHVCVVTFGANQFLNIGFSARPDRIAAAMQQTMLRRGGITELNGAIAAAAMYLNENARPDSTRAIVMATVNDGHKELSDQAVRDSLWRANITLNGLLPPDAAPKREGPDVGDIRPLIEASGGDSLAMDAKSVPLAEMLRNLHERYLIQFRAADGEPKTIHNITVDLTPEAKARLKDVTIRARGGYVIESK